MRAGSNPNRDLQEPANLTGKPLQQAVALALRLDRAGVIGDRRTWRHR